MLIRGGATYAFEQVNAELTTFLATQYPVLATEQGSPSFAVAVCGLRVLSEHEDECCVMIELLNEDVRNSGVAEEIMQTFLSSAKVNNDLDVVTVVGLDSCTSLLVILMLLHSYRNLIFHTILISHSSIIISHRSIIDPILHPMLYYHPDRR